MALRTSAVVVLVGSVLLGCSRDAGGVGDRDPGAGGKADEAVEAPADLAALARDLSAPGTLGMPPIDAQWGANELQTSASVVPVPQGLAAELDRAADRMIGHREADATGLARRDSGIKYLGTDQYR